MPALERGPTGPSRNIVRPARLNPPARFAESRRARYVERIIPPRSTKQPLPNDIRRNGTKFAESVKQRPELAEREAHWLSQMRDLRKGGRHTAGEIDVFVAKALAHQEEETRKAKESSERDELTTLYNRKGIVKRFASVLSRAERTGEPFSIAVMDLDRFKDVNDTYGHECGDQVLRHTATHLRESGREHDIWGRIGGEELIGILPGETVHQATRAMERQRIHLPESVDTALTKTGEFNVTRDITMSIGVVTFDLRSYEEKFGTRPEQLRRILLKQGRNLPEMGSMPQRDRVAILKEAENERKQTIFKYLMNKADHAMYKAKESGRDKVVAATEDPHGNELFVEGRAMPAVSPIYDRMG